MKVALISTVFNEGEDIFRWAEALRKQTRHPDEFVIVDGGSMDGTPERLRQAFNHGDFPAPKIIVEKCNIARGRNIAIQNTTAEIIAATDAGSFPAPDWLVEITQPLLADPALDVTGGLNITQDVTPFQKYLLQLESREETGVNGGGVHPSSRNTAFRRGAFAAVGGYPEWLTLAGEDALFTHELNLIGKKCMYNSRAVVRWSLRETAAAYYRLLYRNAYGAAEAQLFWPYFRQRLVISLCPPLLLLSRHRFKHLKFRYLKNVSSARGWLAGKISGHRPPPGWRRVDGILLSPEALKNFCKNEH
ncbi:MAG TPA: glycosyltransferase [Candidatus Sulfotelmatobacter sp.]|jgi:glycosyltransferase involved in cell wall biosynthesis|nr:glycosyltransferase [Candidatus Sulfotelmatobacter sp.]